VRYETLTGVTMKSTVFCDVLPPGLLIFRRKAVPLSSGFTTTTYNTQHFSQIQGTQTAENNHIPISQRNTYYINTRPGRHPEKYIDRRDTSTHNYDIQTKHKETVYIHLILMIYHFNN
jgi:hypothetical protein